MAALSFLDEDEISEEDEEDDEYSEEENVDAELQKNLEEDDEYSEEENVDAELQKDLPEEAKEAGYKIHPDKLASLVGSFDIKTLRKVGGVKGLASLVKASFSEGVASTDAQIRKDIYGLNTYTEKPSKSFWMFVWEAFHDVTLIILIVCAVVSIGVGLAWPKGIYDGLGIILSILLVVMVTAVGDYKQSLQFRDLDREKKNIFTQVTRDGSRLKVSIFDLVVGDIVHLSIGDQVPADGIFISDESVPINVHERCPFLLAGNKVQDGSGKMLVTTVGMRTEWGKLMQTLSEVGEIETPLQVKLNGVATIIGKIGLRFSVLTFFVLVVRFLVEKAIRHEFAIWSCTDALTLLNYFATAVTIFVVAVSEGLPLALTLSLAFAMKKLMDDKALVRHLFACETMGSAACICTHKTGTLTTNNMVVTKIWMDGRSKEIVANGQTDSVRPDISDKALSLLLQAIFHNTSAEVVEDKSGKQSILGTPTESALLKYGMRLANDFQDADSKLLEVEPFNSEKKRMSVLVALSNGTVRAFCKGASEIIVEMCDSIIDSHGEPVPLYEEQRNAVMEAINGFACEALRTLCLAYKDISNGHQVSNIPVDGYTLIAIVGIKDPVRPEVKEAVKTCREAGIIVRMVTGDNIDTAKVIAKECGILTEGGIAIEGPEFRTMIPEQMGQIIPNIQVMARSSPTDKHKLVKYLRGMGEVVALTGDGTNDAPALQEADIGLAMGIVGTEAARESCDVIVLDDNFTTIVNVAKWGRAVYINIQKFVQFQLTGSIVAVMVNFVSACITGSAPLTAVQLLWVNLIMDTLGALALVTEPPHEGLMNRKPVHRDASFITKIMWRNIIGQSIYQIIILLAFIIVGKYLLILNGSNATMILNTFIFNTFVFCQVFNVINSRDIEKINVFRNLFSSRIFLGVMAATVVFQIIIVEFPGAFASTIPLSWPLWVISVGIGAASMVVALVLKFITVVGEEAAKPYDGYILLPSGPEMA